MTPPRETRHPAPEADPLLELARDPGAWTAEDVLQRARRYLRDGRVRKLELDTDQGALLARVDGRRKTPYKVRVDVSEPDPSFECTCPYDGDPLCKHGAAALLAHLRRLEGEGPLPGPTARGERRRRARKESWTMRNVGPDRYLSTFEVRGDSGRDYTVEIRDPGGLVNRCTCPDHRTNLLGTCKHIEAVLDELRRRAPVKMERLAEGPPPVGQLLVRWDGPPRIALHMPADPSAGLRRFRRDHFDAEGYLVVTGSAAGGAASAGREGREEHEERGLGPAVVAGAAGEPEAGNGRGLEAGTSRARRAAFLATVPGVLEAASGIDDLRVHDDVRELLEAERQAARQVAATAELAARLREDGLDPAQEIGVDASLYPYQEEGVAFLASRGRAILADDMGLGKTLQALAAFALLRHRGAARRALVVCPASLKHQWKEEAERFTDLSVQVVEGRPDDREAQYRRGADLTVVNYELVLRDREVIGPALAADLLILDEAQRIRNWRTKTAGAVKELESDRAFILTGTPLENRLEDLYSLMQVVDPRILGPLWSFRHRYVATDPGSDRVTGYRNLDELRQRLEPVVLRRTRAEVLDDLPGLVVNRFRLDLTEEQREAHDEAEREIAVLAAIARRRKLKPDEERRLLLLLNVARMACNAASLLDAGWWEEDHPAEVMLDEALRWPKLRELRRLLDELCVDDGKKVVVFSEWRRMQRMAEAVAADLGLDPVSLHGGVPTERRGALIARFRDRPGCRVFLSTDAGGVGLNLQAAEAVIVLDLPWNPAVLSQRVARVHRHGQKGSVHVLQLVGRDCLEQRLERLLEGKRSLFDAALGASDLSEMPRPSTSARMVRAAMEAYAVGGDTGGTEATGTGDADSGVEAAGAADPDGDVEVAGAGDPDDGVETAGAEGPDDTVETAGTGDPGAVDTTARAAAPGAGAEEEETVSIAPGGSTREAGGTGPSRTRRHREFADRQLEAAEVLAAAGLGGPSLVSIHAAIRSEILAAIGELADGEGPSGEGPSGAGASEASLLQEGLPEEPTHDWLVDRMYRHLVPEPLDLEEASLLGQARDLAGAFGSSSSVPPGLAEPLLERLGKLRDRLRERRTRPPDPAPA